MYCARRSRSPAHQICQACCSSRLRVLSLLWVVLRLNPHVYFAAPFAPVTLCVWSFLGTLGRLRKGRMRRKPAVFENLERKFVDRGSLLTARTDTDITLTPMEM